MPRRAGAYRREQGYGCDVPSVLVGRDAAGYSVVHQRVCYLRACQNTDAEEVWGDVSYPYPFAGYGWAVDGPGSYAHVSRRKNMLWVAVCRRTKWVIVVACTVDIGTSAIIDMLRRYVMVPFGTTPEHIICDNDIRFTSNEFIRFCTDENIEVRYAATYHPQTDGQTERANLTICNMLRTKLENRAQDWTRYLPSVVKAYNGSIHASTKMSPFYAIYGRHPRQLIDVAVPQAFPVVSDPVRARNEAQVKLDANVARASAAQKRYFDRKRQELTMVPGDKVYVDARYLPKRATMTKMHHRREGPFRVTRVIGNGKAYVVDVPYGYDNMRGVTFSTDKLVPYRESLRWGLDRRNGAGRTEWDDDALPERILGHFQRQGETKRYLVRYRGHHPGLDQWVPGGTCREVLCAPTGGLVLAWSRWTRLVEIAVLVLRTWTWT